MDVAPSRGARAAGAIWRYRRDCGFEDRHRSLDLSGTTKERTLKADPFEQLSLLDLQAQDSTLAQLAHRKSSLPEVAELAALAGRASEADGQRIEAETAVADLTRDQQKAAEETEQVKARRANDEERLMAGLIKNPRDMEKMQQEVVALNRRIGTLEDEELEVMEALEQAQARLASVQAELAEINTAIAAATTSRDEQVAVIDAEARTVSAEREEIARKIPAELMALYDKLAKQYGNGAAALRARRCEGCRLELNSADLRELAGRPDDDVLRCPECSRILVRTLESGISA